MKGYKNIILGFFLMLSVGILRGQNISYKLYTLHDGLPQSQILCMFQDSRGYIWTGTHYGAAYFNGVKFQSITPKDGVPYPSVRQIQEDEKGNIWFYTGKWFCKYDGKKLTYDTANIRLSESWFFLDKSFVAWGVNIRDHLLYKSKDFKNWECVSSIDKNLENKQWKTLRYDKAKDVLVLEDLASQRFIYTKDKLIPIKGVGFQHIGVSNNDLKFGTFADSIFLLEKGGVKFLKKTNNVGVADVIQRPNGKMYFIAPQGKGLYTFNERNIIDFTPLNISSTVMLFEDKDKNVWIGTEEGLMRIYTEGFSHFDKKQLNSVWSMVDDTDGSMWFGSIFSPNAIQHYKNGRLDSVKVDYNIMPTKYNAPNRFGEFYLGGGRDKKGNLYFPMSWGIMKYDGKKFSAFDKPSTGEPLSMFFHLDEQKKRIVSAAAEGVNIIDLETGATKYYGAAKGLHRTAYVLGVGKDGSGNYWVGTNNGLAKLDLSKDSFTQNYVHNVKGFPYYSVAAVLGDSKGNIWAGCSRGLLRYDTKLDSFFLVADKIIGTAVNALAMYKDRYLVIGGMDGIYFLDLKAFYTEGGKEVVRCFNQHNGYLGIEPNQNGLYVDAKDNIWIAASDIVSKLTPSELDMSPKPLLPHITTINGDKIPYENYNQIINLPYGTNTAEIRFEAIGFERPFEDEFSYKIDNGEWQKWRVEDFAVLDNLASGVYTFSVRTRPAGTVNESDYKVTSVRFKIDIPIPKQPYFPYLAFMILIILGSLVWWYFHKKRKEQEKANKQHQETVEQRKRLELLNTEMSHRVRNNLNIMQQIMSMQARRVKNPEAKTILKEGVDRIQAMSILHNHLIAFNESESLMMKEYIVELCDKVRTSYSDDAKNLAFQIDIDHLSLDEIFGRHIGLIVSELLTNSIKHAFSNQPKPQIKVRLYEFEGAVSLEYQDNGKGIPKEFDMNETSSLGMKLIYGISERFGGKVKLENRDGFYCHIEFEKRIK
jgi:two-component sensor histidine kinase/ligand-binding sensor domain-containing protein